MGSYQTLGRKVSRSHCLGNGDDRNSRSRLSSVLDSKPISGDHSLPSVFQIAEDSPHHQPLHRLETGVEEGSPEMTEIEFPAQPIATFFKQFNLKKCDISYTQSCGEIFIAFPLFPTSSVK